MVEPKKPMKIINDSVHGHIELPEICMAIVDTIQFQRLRDLKQLGSSYYVYPGAAHNRFEHSIGVCHLAGEYSRNLQQQQPELDITPKDILCLQIAGLCHDLGHGPFSHLWERFLHRQEVHGDHNVWKHETKSIAMFKHLVKENNLIEKPCWELNDDDLVFIGELIWRADDTHMSTLSRAGKPFLYEIVNNKKTGIDVDKWDYLLRDGLHLNIKTSFDYHRVMKFSRVIDGHIAYRDKEIENLIEMFTIREKLHRQAYQHRVSKVVEEMIIDALVAADEWRNLSEASRDMSQMSDYTKLSDYIFYEILYSQDENLSESRKILDRIQQRDFYGFIGKLSVLDKALTEQSIKDGIKNGVPDKDIVVSKCRFNYGHGNKNPIFEAYSFSKHDVYQAKKIEEKDVPPTLPKKYEEIVYFIYYKGKADTKLQEMKRSLQQWAKDNEYFVSV